MCSSGAGMCSSSAGMCSSSACRDVFFKCKDVSSAGMSSLCESVCMCLGRR